MIEYKKVILYLSGSYIVSLSLHYWNINSIRISEIIFLLLFLVFLYGILKKHILIKITKSDLIAGLFLTSNIIILLTYNSNFNGIISTIFSLYLFLIYYIFKNILEIFHSDIVIKSIITLTLFTSFLGILGWFLYQINIENILANERNYPLTLGKSVQSAALYTTHNLLTYSLIIGIFILLKTKIKKEIKLIFFIIFNIALFFTFSKSILIYLGLIILLLSFRIINKYLKNLLIISSIIIFLIQILLTNFLILNKSNDNLWVNENYTHPEVKPIYENKNIKIIKTNYYFLKEKSFYLIKENFFKGIGYENFRNNNNKYPILKDQKPHSTYFGIFSEFGIMGIISIIFLLIYNLNISIKNKEYLMSLLIIYLLIEGINTDIVSLKLTWIIFSINCYIHNKKN
jgi:hypothetical protein